MESKSHYFLWACFSVCVWMVFIFILSSVPGGEIPNVAVPHFHRVVHFFEYAVLGALWVRVFVFWGAGLRHFKISLMAWVLTAVFALSDEWHQTFIAGRSGRLEDVLFDGFCAVFGIFIYFYGWIDYDRKMRMLSGAQV